MPDVESHIRDKVMRMLMRREHSLFELRQKLSSLAEHDPLEILLNELIQQGVQSDQRFAEMLCRSRFNAGKGPVKVEYELSQHQISTEIICEEMSHYEGKWAASARAVRDKKFGEAPARTYREWVKQAKFLQQRGFGSEYIDKFIDS